MGNKNYIISSKDYRNFWEILNNIGAKLQKEKLKAIRRESYEKSR